MEYRNLWHYKFLYWVVTLIFLSIYVVNADLVWIRYCLLLHMIIVATSLVRSGDPVFIFNPLVICLVYFNVNFLIGSYAFDQGFVNLEESGYLTSHPKEMLRTTVIIILINSIIFSILKNTEKKSFNTVYISRAKIWLLLFVYSLLIPLELVISEQINTQGGIFSIPRFIIMTYILFSVYNLDYKYKKSKFAVFGVFSFLFFIITLVMQYDSKREILFFFIALVFIVAFSRKHRIRFNAAHLLAIFLGSLISIYLIMGMSIYRGYGNYDVDNVFQAFQYVPEYVEENQEFAFRNLESPVIFSHALTASSIGINSPVYTFTSFWRTALVLFPSNFVDFKPDSIIAEYSYFVNQHRRAEGWSTIPSIYGEFFWSFGILGMFVLIFIFSILQKLYFFLIRKSETNLAYVSVLIFFTSYVIMFFRGSGLDLFLQYLLIAFVVSKAINFKFISN